ncbi:LuxR family transcriptional regulator [Chakrabartia godavariana]|nr:LuxR family transcriptional regulator [Chakrabartia godavariana]
MRQTISDADRVAALSDGQRACLRMVAEHRSSKEIARALNISPHTVDKRLEHALRKLGVTTRWEAARMFAAYEGLVYEPLPVADRAPVPPSPSQSSDREGMQAGSVYLLQPTPGTDVVPVTWLKATSFPEDPQELIERLLAGFEAAKNGTAFGNDG